MDLLFKAFDADLHRLVDPVENHLELEVFMFLDQPVNAAILKFSFVAVESIIFAFGHIIANPG